MIQIFRRIRQNLLASNRLRQYLVYALGEIALVMIGILLALQVNNWNEARKTDQRMQTYIQNIIMSLDQDIVMMVRSGNQYAFKAHSGQYLLHQAGASLFNWENDGLNVPEFNYTDASYWDHKIPSEHNKEFIRIAFLWSTRLADLEISTSVLDEMKSTGLFTKLPDELKRSIERYIASWNANIGPSHQAKMEAYVKDWENSLGALGLFNSSVDELEDPLSLLRDDSDRVFLLKLLIRESGWFSRCAKLMKERAEDIKSGLQEYLNEI